jgi:HEAT repeat protein
MEFLTRPVAPYLVPVPGFEPDPDASVDILGEVHPLDVATAGRSGQTPSARHAAGPGHPQPFQPAESVADGADQERLRALLRLNEPDVEALLPFTTDADPVVRRTALELLTESSDAAAGPLLTAALGDENADVRVTAAAGLREVVELLGDSAEVDHGLHAARASEDPVVRAAALDLLRALRRTAPEVFARHLEDPDPAVRRQAVRGLVSLDALAGLTPVVSDPDPEVRLAVATGLNGVAGATPLLLALVDDPERRVAAAALEGARPRPGTHERLTLTAVARRSADSPAWELRRAAATALADDPSALPTLLHLAGDPHPDVRRAAVLALQPHTRRPQARTALRAALSDADADVRAYARRALGPAEV